MASNYSLASTTGLSATIDKAALTISGTTASNKTYDGTTDASVSAGSLSGLVGDETLSVSATGTFDSKNAGARTVTADYSLSDGSNGGLASNYSLASTSHNATIDKADLVITANDASKTYDGRAYNGGNGVNYRGFVSGEDNSVLGGTLTYGGSAQGARDAGTYTLSANGLTAGNYAIHYQDGTLQINAPMTSSQPDIGMQVSNGHTIAHAPKEQVDQPTTLNTQMLMTNPLAEVMNLQVINQGLRLPEGL